MNISMTSSHTAVTPSCVAPVTAAARGADFYDVIVIGAGLSGLNAARVLGRERAEREGLRVVVLEARKRVGGRTETVGGDGDSTYADLVDLGRAYVDPKIDRQMMTIVEELGLSTYERSYRGRGEMVGLRVDGETVGLRGGTAGKQMGGWKGG